MPGVIESARGVLDLIDKDGEGCRCEARTYEECGCPDAEWFTPAEARSVIADLLAIVERLQEALRSTREYAKSKSVGPGDNMSIVLRAASDALAPKEPTDETND